MPRDEETKVERAVCRYAEQTYGMLTFKWSSPSRMGVTDRIFITREGLIAFIEFKKPGDRDRFLAKPRTKTEHQQHRTLAALAEYRCETFVVDTEESGRQLVDLISDAEQYQRVRYGRDQDIIVPASLSDPRR